MKKFFEKIKKKIAIYKLRKAIESFGISAVGLGDQELLESCVNFGKAAANAGISFSQAVKNLKKLNVPII